MSAIALVAHCPKYQQVKWGRERGKEKGGYIRKVPPTEGQEFPNSWFGFPSEAVLKYIPIYGI